MNKVILIGNIATDPEAFTTSSGISRSSFRLAVQRRFRNTDGTRDTDFFNVVAWRSTADFCNRYLRKGSRIAVEGSVQNRSYDGNDGVKRYVTEVIAENVESVGDRASGPAYGAENTQTTVPANNRSGMPAPSSLADDDGDELPF